MISMNIQDLLREFASGTSLTAFYDDLFAHMARTPDHHVFITPLSRAQVQRYVDALLAQPQRDLPLYGVPFVIKDNIDLQDVPTTAGCPAFAYTPTQHAVVVQKLIDAGAIPLGKANMDQFATGLVGARSPYGAGLNSHHRAYVSGGSSSGSALAVALGFASFSLGTDTAGSGRVPAAFNNLIGLKPSVGRLSTRGLVPACRSIDCISVFALHAGDAARVLSVCEGFDVADEWSRPALTHPASGALLRANVRVGLPRADQLQFFGDSEYQRLFAQSCARLRALGAELVELDFAPLFAAARLLYEGPWVAERYAAVDTFIRAQPDALHPVTRTITEGALNKTAVQTFQAQYQMQAYRRCCESLLQQADFFVTPTAGTIYTLTEVEAEPIRLNANLGYYTNFMNLLDLAAVSVPQGFRDDGLPFGITVFAARDTDHALLRWADRLQRAAVSHAGVQQQALPDHEWPAVLPEFMPIAVCGAHMQGLPLNSQLTRKHAYLLERTRTAAEYRLYALPGGPPYRPGMVRVDHNGHAIEVEVWALHRSLWGELMAQIPAPLGLGPVRLDNGSMVTGFVCEAAAISGAEDISALGGWRAYLNRR